MTRWHLTHLDGGGAQHHVQPHGPHGGHVGAHDVVACFGHDRHVLRAGHRVEAHPQKVDAHLLCQGFDLCVVAGDGSVRQPAAAWLDR